MSTPAQYGSPLITVGYFAFAPKAGVPVTPVVTPTLTTATTKPEKLTPTVSMFETETWIAPKRTLQYALLNTKTGAIAHDVKIKDLTAELKPFWDAAYRAGKVQDTFEDLLEETVKSLYITTDAAIETRAKKAVWLTGAKNGVGGKWVRLSDLSSEHLEAIVEDSDTGAYNVPDWKLEVIEYILGTREL